MQGKTRTQKRTLSILDELLHQDGITKEEYTRLNNTIAESLGDGIDEEKEEMEVEEEEKEEMSREEKIKKLIKTTTEYLIEDDKKELTELIKEMKQDEEYIDTVQELDELIEYFLEQFLDGEPIMTKLDEVIRKLDFIPKSKQHRLKMLLGDISQNQKRVHSILTRLSETSNVPSVLKQRIKEGLISEEQFEKLVEHEDLDLPIITRIIKETKIGQGLKFLPKTIGNLTDTLQLMIQELIDTGSSVIREKITSILEELLNRKAITRERYTAIKEEHNIV